jgi:hypothetical protein
MEVSGQLHFPPCLLKWKLVGPIAGLDAAEKRSDTCILPEWEPNHVVQSIYRFKFPGSSMYLN